MAVSKAAKKSAAKGKAAKSGQQASDDSVPAGKRMANWEEQLAQIAEQGADTAASAASGGRKSIGTRGGVFNIDGENVGNELSVVILGYTLENAYYADRFDPDTPSIPVCFAFGPEGTKEKDMAPIPEDVEDLQNPTCAGCWANEFASADTGKGKACKNQAKLMLISEDDLEDVEGSEPRTIKVPVTSRGNFTAYVQNLKEKFSRPPLAVITRISLKPHPKHQFEMNFTLEGQIEGEVIGELIEKRDLTVRDLTKKYEPIPEDEKPAPRGRNKAARGKAEQVAPSRGAAARRQAPQQAQGKRAGRGR